MAQIESYPGEVVAINGSETGPWPPAPASSFTYDVNVCLPGGMQLKQGCKPNVERWPDELNSTPIRIGTLVTVYVIGDKVVMADRELPFFAPCPPPGGTSRGSTLLIRELIAAVKSMDWTQKAELRRALDL